MQMFGAISGETVRAAAQGDAAAREVVLKTLLPRVQAMILVRLAPTPAQFSAIDDLTQQSLVAIGEGLGTMREPTPDVLASYASTVVARMVATFLRQEAAEEKHRQARSLDSAAFEGSAVGVLKDFLEASTLTPRSAVGQAEQVRQVLVALGEMKPQHHEIITLAFFDQLPIDEIAERMGLAKPAASMLLVRAVRALRRMMTGSSRLGDIHDKRK